MKRFAQLVLILQFVSISVYTGYVALKYGTDLFNVFFGEMLSLTWTGQFHFDFWNYLVLTAVWVAWREKFTLKAIVLAVVAHIFGLMFLAPYLLFLSFKTNGNVKEILVGDR
ncbi:hypothetical protein N9Y60_02610 [Crocinitomicaceae bacterium]|nr:hypothetical protein [Crocinitomicaceae bacterium]MDB3906145.1 hypothetical protein [Crocinitomicaceae bacterium]